MIKKTAFLSIFSLATLSVTAACTSETNRFMAQDTASRMARPAFMVERTIPAGDFGLAAWERMHERYAPVTIYIGGSNSESMKSNALKDAANIEGAEEINTRLSKRAADPRFQNEQKSKDINAQIITAPSNPVGLHLATRDTSKNLAFLAQPCQYISGDALTACKSMIPTNAAFSQKVIDGYDAAISSIKAQYDLTKIHLVGYGDGAQIAALLTATRKDVVSLRTVAGNLNHAFVSNQNASEALSGSLNARDIAAQIAHVPQHHFIGGLDTHITPGVYHSYRQAMGNSSCVQYSLIPQAEHSIGWVNEWPNLVKTIPSCSKAAFEPYESGFEPYIPSRDGNPYKGKGMGKGLSRSYSK